MLTESYIDNDKILMLEILSYLTIGTHNKEL